MLEDFRTYMLKNGYRDVTVSGYSRMAEKFLGWCDQMDLVVENITYTQWLNYQNLIKTRITSKGKPLKDTSIQQEIGAIRLLFDFMVHEDVMAVNPIHEIYYKVDNDFHHELLSEEELFELYFTYQTENLKGTLCPSVAIRDKMIIGLFVFQGIDTKTLKKMTVDHVNLDAKKIYVPGTVRSNPRTLDLNSVQINLLRQYLDHDREILQSKISCYTEALIPLNTGRLGCIITGICKKLRSINLKVTNLWQLRASVITLWTKKYDLRRVQIMAGHRNITSTENYIKTDLDLLKNAMAMYHPMR